MKTLILLLLLAVPAFSQIEQIASASSHPKGPVAYFIDKGSIVFKGNEATFTGIETGISEFGDEFRIDTSEYLIFTDFAVNCSTRKFRILRTVGIDGSLFNHTEKSNEKAIPKGKIIDLATQIVCKERKTLKA